MSLFFRHFGTGQAVIILHGLFGQSDNWITLARRISNQFSVYIPDQRNHGQSFHASVHTYPALSDDLLRFIEEQQLEKTILIGHSMGGKVAMLFALEHPEMVEKLVIIDISPRKYTERNIHSQVITQMLSIDLESQPSRKEVENILEKNIKDAPVRMFILKNLFYLFPGKLAWRINLEVINQSLDDLFEAIQSNEHYSGPCLFIKGGNSDYITDDDTERILDLFPKALIKKISGASHWVHADAPEELCYLLSSFLERKCEYIPRKP